jgi:hypothetical protein
MPLDQLLSWGAMAIPTHTTTIRALRQLGPVPWFHDGCSGLALRARADVPRFDDTMIRSALLRGVEACERLAALDRAINRELWPLGYVAFLERSVGDDAVVLVEIAAGR